MSELELRPMGIGDILDVTFRLYRDHFVTFLIIGLVVYVPYALVAGPLQTAAGPSIAELRTMHEQSGPFAEQAPADSAATMQIGTVLPAAIGVGLFALIALPLCTAAYIQNISAAYLGTTLGAWESYQRAAPRLLPLLVTQLLFSILVGIGYLLCIVPGIILTFWFLLVGPVVVLEEKWGPAALRRSRELIRGNIGKAFLLAMVVSLITMVFSWILGIVVASVPWPHEMAAPVVVNMLQVLIVPLQSAPFLLLYYDLRIRKEAFDLEQLASLQTVGVEMQ